MLIVFDISHPLFTRLYSFQNTERIVASNKNNNNMQLMTQHVSQIKLMNRIAEWPRQSVMEGLVIKASVKLRSLI